MEALELFGILAVTLGIIGMVVMLKGKRPSYRSTPKLTKSR